MNKSNDILDNYDDEEEEKEQEKKANDLKLKTTKKSYFEEQDEIKKSLKEAVKRAKNDDNDDEDDDDNDFLKIKNKSNEEKEKEEALYIEWLKGRKETIKDEDAQKNMVNKEKKHQQIELYFFNIKLSRNICTTIGMIQNWMKKRSSFEIIF
jgi:small-conductance mechanosensitive channel